MASRRFVIAGTCGLAVAIGVSGCSNTRASAYRANPTPKIDTVAQTSEEIQNSLTLTNDTNFRMFWNDMGRFWLEDKRSNLTPGPNF